MPPIVAWSTVDVSGPNSRPCGAAAALSDAWTTPGSTRARRAVRVDREDAVELEAVDDDAGPDGLAGEAGGGAARDERHAVLRGGRRRGREVVRRRRHDDHVGHDAVDRGVGGVEPAAERRRGDLAGDRAAQRVRGGAPLRRELGDAVAGAHGAKDTAARGRPRGSRQSPPGLNAGSQRAICSSTPNIMSTPKTTSSDAGPDLDGAVVPLDEAEARAHPVEGQRGEHERHAEADRVDEQEQRPGHRALAGRGHAEDGAEHVADARRPADGESGAGEKRAAGAGAAGVTLHEAWADG